MSKSERRAGSKGEDQWTSDLVGLLNSRHDLGARAFPIYHLREGARRLQSKPDFIVTKGGLSVGSAKLGQDLELRAFATAAEYQNRLPRTEELRGASLHETFAVTYPRSNSSESFRLHILPRPGRLHELSLSTPSLLELADTIAAVIEGRIGTVESLAEPTEDEATRLLTRAALELAQTIRRVPLGSLEGIFGGHNFFQSIFASKKELKGEKRAATLRLGVAFLFVNQVLFYVLLSRAAEESGHASLYPTIAEDDLDSPRKLEESYFNRVRAIDYEPIYGIPVSGIFSEKNSVDATRDVVRAIRALAPSINTRDLAGQVFQGLIDPDIRKPLGAHYTNPKAAELLAQLTVTSGHAKVMDPACGSGTLLVSAYLQKRRLLPAERPADAHREILENELTGIDAMAFAAHLAAVNLALQEPLLETEHVRIATTDSTFLKPGDSVQVTEESLPWSLRQSTLAENFGERPPRLPKRRGPAQLRRTPPRPFTAGPVDVVLMNPPFTSWENMSKPYRESLKERFGWIEKQGYKGRVWWRVSQQAFFILLADRFLVDGGRMGAVLPFTTFTGRAFEPFIHYLTSNYTIDAIVVGLGRASFSEDTSLTECLLLATKSPPPKGHRVVIVGMRTVPESWSKASIEQLVNQLRTHESSSDAFSVTKTYPQEELLPWRSSLSTLALSLLEPFESALRAWEEVSGHSGTPLLDFAAFSKRTGIEATRLASYFGSRPASYFGASALFILRHEERGSRKADRLHLKEASAARFVAEDSVGQHAYRFPREITQPALRRLSFLHSVDVTSETDLVVTQPGGDLRQAFEAIYDPPQADVFLRRISAQAGGGLRELFGNSSSRLCLMRRMDLSAEGTSMIAVRGEEPFLVACDAFLFRGLRNPVQEKFLALWFNSTPFILQFLGHATFTRGTWLKMEDFILNRLTVPFLSEAESLTRKKEIESAYDALSSESFPSLLDQMGESSGPRTNLDDTILMLLGISSPIHREKIGRVLREGVRTALLTLKQTMGGEGAADGSEDEETE